MKRFAAGLIADVYSDGEFDSAVENLTCRLTNGPGDAFRWTKDAVNDATLTELDNAFARERNGQLELLATPTSRKASPRSGRSVPPRFAGPENHRDRHNIHHEEGRSDLSASEGLEDQRP